MWQNKQLLELDDDPFCPWFSHIDNVIQTSAIEVLVGIARFVPYHILPWQSYLQKRPEQDLAAVCKSLNFEDPEKYGKVDLTKAICRQSEFDKLKRSAAEELMRSIGGMSVAFQLPFNLWVHMAVENALCKNPSVVKEENIHSMFRLIREVFKYEEPTETIRRLSILNSRFDAMSQKPHKSRKLPEDFHFLEKLTRQSTKGIVAEMMEEDIEALASITIKDILNLAQPDQSSINPLSTSTKQVKECAVVSSELTRKISAIAIQLYRIGNYPRLISLLAALRDVKGINQHVSDKLYLLLPYDQFEKCREEQLSRDALPWLFPIAKRLNLAQKITDKRNIIARIFSSIQWKRDQWQAPRKHQTFKIFILGGPKVGKTTWLEHCTGHSANPHSNESELLIPMADRIQPVQPIEHDDDHGQSEEYLGGCICIYSITSSDSFTHALSLPPPYNHPTFLLGNKNDLDGRQVKSKYAEKHAKRNGWLFEETSAKSAGIDSYTRIISMLISSFDSVQQRQKSDLKRRGVTKSREDVRNFVKKVSSKNGLKAQDENARSPVLESAQSAKDLLRSK